MWRGSRAGPPSASSTPSPAERRGRRPTAAMGDRDARLSSPWPLLSAAERGDRPAGPSASGVAREEEGDGYFPALHLTTATSAASSHPGGVHDDVRILMPTSHGDAGIGVSRGSEGGGGASRRRGMG